MEDYGVSFMLKKINYIFTRKQKIKMFGIFILTIIAGMLEILGVSAILPLVSVILTPDIIQENKLYVLVADVFNLDSTTKFMYFTIIMLIGVYIAKNVFLLMEYKIQLKFTYSCNEEINFRLMKCYMNQDYLYHVSHNVADIQRNVMADVTTFFNMVQAAMNLLVEVITSVLILIYLIWLDIWTTLMLVAFLSIALFFVYKILKRNQVRQGELSRNNSGRLTRWLLQIFGGIKEIKAGNREDFFYTQYKNAYDDGIKIGMRHNLLSKTPKYIMETLCISVMLIVIGLRISMGVEMTTYMATISSIAFAAVRLLPAFNRITEYLGNIFYAYASTDNIYMDLKNEKELQQNLMIIKKEEKKLELKEKLEIKNIYFRYPEGERLIFDNASITIKKNESVAFIGPSGTGKTTLVDILLGLLMPYKGSVMVDETDIYKHLYAWHMTIGYIPQTIYLLDDTIRANIVFGSLKDNERDIWECLEKAQLNSFVHSLPVGLNTTIGEAGAKLSGGQRQRIGIARALYSKPDILVLDEATSALDNETENAVMESIEQLQGSITLIIIAHRLTTIKQCDRIYEVVNGKIIEKSREDVLREE